MQPESTQPAGSSEKGVAISPHALATLIPAMSEDEYRELRDDIAEHGLHDPVVTYEGRVLDGRHRLRACNELAICPRLRAYDGDAPAAFVIGANVKRRHLSASQRAAIAVELLPHLEAEARERQRHAGRHGSEGGRGNKKPSGPTGPEGLEPDRARDEAATAAGASPRSVQRAKRVRDKDPELHEQVKAGELTVGAAS